MSNTTNINNIIDNTLIPPNIGMVCEEPIVSKDLKNKLSGKNINPLLPSETLLSFEEAQEARNLIGCNALPPEKTTQKELDKEREDYYFRQKQRMSLSRTERQNLIFHGIVDVFMGPKGDMAPMQNLVKRLMISNPRTAASLLMRLLPKDADHEITTTTAPLIIDKAIINQ